MAGPAAILAWMIGGGVSFLIALVYAETVPIAPVAGSIARIPFFTHGSLGGFLAGWLCLIAYLSTAPIEVMAVLDYATNYIPGLTVNVHGERVLTHEGLAIAAAMLVLFAFINLKGVQWLARANTVITFWKLVIPFIAPIALMLTAFDTSHFSAYDGFAPAGASGVFAAVAGGGVMFSFMGFRALLDMAGEVRNPQRNVPLALFGTIAICTVLYILLQVAFIGSIPSDHLKDGWGAIAENAAGGPFAAFAALLGLKWLALLLYVDAVLSPGGSGLAYTGFSPRLNYALAKNGDFPKIFEKLNKNGVPVWGIIINTALGMVMLAPFPSWQSMVAFISSAATLSLIFGPISLMAMRAQLPDAERPFRVPFAKPIAATAFVLVGWLVYWTGWENNWKLFIVLAIGLTVMLLSRAMSGRSSDPLHVRQSLWVLPYLSLIAVTSYIGNFGGGAGLVPEWLDMLLIAVGSVVIFEMAIRQRLPDDEARALVEAARGE